MQKEGMWEMFDFRRIFNPTPEELQAEYKWLNDLIRNSLAEKGPDCTNCKYSKTVQESPYYDYTTCKFDNSVELPGGLDHRYFCDRYEFIGFLEVEDNETV
jgi:hypothetical protein